MVFWSGNTNIRTHLPLFILYNLLGDFVIGPTASLVGRSLVPGREEAQLSAEPPLGWGGMLVAGAPAIPIFQECAMATKRRAKRPAKKKSSSTASRQILSDMSSLQNNLKLNSRHSRKLGRVLRCRTYVESCLFDDLFFPDS